MYLNRSLTIKDTKTLIVKKLDNDNQSIEGQSNLSKSENTNSNYINKSQNIIEKKNETFKSVEIASNKGRNFFPYLASMKAIKAVIKK